MTLRHFHLLSPHKGSVKIDIHKKYGPQSVGVVAMKFTS